MFLKSKKYLISIVSLSLLSITTLSCFATAGSDGQTPGNPSQSSSSSQIGQIINLNDPSKDYTLVGKDKSSGVAASDSVILVDKEDQIQISKPGTYNITMDNVNINVSDVDSTSAFKSSAKSNTIVNLTLLNHNILKGNNFGIDFRYYSNLNITDNSTGSIYISGREAGIITGGDKNITINGGNVTVFSDGPAVDANLTTINGANTKVTSTSVNESGFFGSLIINDGIIDTSGGSSGIRVSDLTVNGGKITAFSKDGCGISSSSINMNGGDITSSGGNGPIFRSEFIDLSNIKAGTINNINANEFLTALLSTTPKNGETAFDKELSSDTKSVDSASVKSAPDTGALTDHHLPLIYLSLGLIFVSVIFTSRRELV